MLREDRNVLASSAEAVLYQSNVLVDELTRINDLQYPDAARELRDVLLAIARYLREELGQLCKSNESSSHDPEEDASRTRALARIIHELYSYIRYLKASSPTQTPPSVQLALGQLTRLHFRKDQKPLCLVRPQWRYNLTYVSMTTLLQQLLNDAALDPEGKLGNLGKDELLSALWSKFGPTQNKPLPASLAILSFAGLDTADTLLYPLLAHELGHFIDYSCAPRLHLDDAVRIASQIPVSKVQTILKEFPSEKATDEAAEVQRGNLVSRTAACIRELLADLIAVRMLGFSFFVALAEFLKALAPWPQPLLTPSGYPGIKFRLKVSFDHLAHTDFPGNPLSFAMRNEEDQSKEKAAKWLKGFMEDWRQRFAEQDYDMAPTELNRRLDAVAEEAIKNTVPTLERLASKVIPDSECARITEHYFSRIAALKQDLPPSSANEDNHAFSEIFAAAWTYQMLDGDSRETNGNGFAEYGKTCKLVLKAVELLAPPPEVLSNAPAPMAIPNRESLEHKGGSAIAAPELRRRITETAIDDNRHLAVIPYAAQSVQGASLDLKLGNWFVTTNRMHLSSLKIGDKETEELLAIGREEFFIPNDGTFLLHPGDLVLGSSLEFIALPADLMAFVEGRSSLGRKGLSVATATHIGPGFHGVVVLELTNLGTVPLHLSPGMPVAQLVFVMLDSPTDTLYRGSSYCQVRP